LVALSDGPKEELNELLLDESVVVLDEDHFISDLKRICVTYLESAKSSIRINTALNSEQKGFWLRRINELQADFRSGKFTMIDEELTKIV
jgi:hypothetical protein